MAAAKISLQRDSSMIKTTSKKNKFKLDPQKVLEPIKNKLNNIDGQRIMNVIDDCIRKIRIASTIPIVLADMERYSVMLGNNLVEKLEHHREYVLQYNSYVTSSDSSADAVTAIKSEISVSLKNVLREFNNSPVSMDSIKDDGEPRLLITFIGSLEELKEMFLERLLTTPAEETERSEYFAHINELYAQNTEIIDRLEKELHESIADREQAVAVKNDEIRKLEADIHLIQKLSEENIRKMRAEKEKQEQSELKEHDSHVAKLQAELSKVKMQLQTLVTDNREAERRLRQNKWKFETEIETTIQKYDHDMGTRQNEYEEIDANYGEEKIMLFELEERFKPIETDYQEIMKERRYKQEKRGEEEKQIYKMIRAATTIQVFWRYYKARRALRKKKGKKKSAKKGGKKGKTK